MERTIFSNLFIYSCQAVSIFVSFWEGDIPPVIIEDYVFTVWNNLRKASGYFVIKDENDCLALVATNKGDLEP